MGANATFIYAMFSVVISTFAFVPYFIDTWKIKGADDTRPTVSGFVCWMLTDMVIFGAMIDGEKIAWQMVPYIVGAWILIGMCVRKSLKIAKLRGESGHLRDAFSDWGRRDTVCISIVVAALTIWAINRNPDHAIVLTIFSFTVGSYPIVKNLLEDPRRESMPAWGMFLVGGIFGVLAITSWTVTGALVPIFFVILQASIFVLCARRYQSRFVAV